MLTGRRIVLGVTGGIAAYKACDLLSRLKKQGADLRVVLTEHAAQFVSPLSFETLSGNPAYTDSFERKYEIGHVSLAKWGELLLIAPATANCMAKLSCGIADDLLSTMALAARSPIMLAPAMNTAMWNSPATRHNLEMLRARGVQIVGPESGHLACGEEDVGRMSEPEAIVRRVEELLNARQDFIGRTVLVTAGPTVERIDPVRFITNRSSGKMGYAIAEAAARRGASVCLISGPTHIPAPSGVEFIRIESSAELCAQVLQRGDAADIIIQAAAPADFTPKCFTERKIKKTGEGMMLELESTTDIAAELGRRKRGGQILVAFAAETHDMLINARKKLEKKNADLVVANDVSRSDSGFGVDTNRITLVTREGERCLELMHKREAADAILDCVGERMCNA